MRTEPAPLWRRLLERYLLAYVWYVHKPAFLIIQATPTDCMEKLATASRPSVKRLHHRNLFQQGRRYFVRPQRDGFRLTTTSSLRWRYRKRTASTTVLNGTFMPYGEDITRVKLQVRINAGYFLDAFLLPAFISSIIIYVPWPPPVIGVLILVLFTTSWMGHRFHAMLEASEMIWFVQKVLEEFIPAEVLALNASTSNTVNYNRDFDEEWQRFYKDKTDNI